MSSVSCTQLFKHQEAAVDFILARGGSGALYMEMGTGKTLCGITLLKELRQKDSSLRMLVICPLSLIESAWGEDIAKFAPDLKFQNLRRKQREFYGDIMVMNYEMTRREDFEATLGYLRSQGPLLLFADESSRVKSFRAQTTQRLLNCLRHFKYIVCASGTPAPNNELEYWPQLRLIGSNRIPDNFYAFRAGYFDLERNGQRVNVNGQIAIEYMRKGFKYKLKPSMKNNFHDILNEVAFTCKLRDCLDLPETIDEHYNISMHPDQKKKYLEMERHMITEVSGKSVPATIALAKMTKLRQLSSGFIYDESHPLEVPNPKLKELRSLIEDIGNQQVIIWCNFRKEKSDILDFLKERGPCSVLDGETKDKDEEIRQFKTGITQYLIANPQSAGHGLTLTNCSQQIFYSLSYSFELYAQCKARTHRAGAKKSTVYHHLLMEKSIEPVILKVLKAKGSKQDILDAWKK